ncbi:MAG: NAD(P)H-dependent oxidoreductase [Methanospirillum sp.]|nr:NAD(P)H-dependent oxidoreductase [Methanospirillum sp.]
MQVCVLNGSPKGEKSITLQYVRFLELAYPAHTFVTCHISKKIAVIEKNREEWDFVCNVIRDADLVLWATPVYVQHVPSQYKRFIELLFERDAGALFAGKYAASISTSVHFFDQKVHEYLQGISEDLGMNWAGSFSAGMNDLMEEKSQLQLAAFGDDILSASCKRRPVLQVYPPVPRMTRSYVPGSLTGPVDTEGKRVLILHDASEDSSLGKMVRQMEGAFSGEVTTCNLDKIGMKGGCLGCVQCAFENQCMYTDGFSSFWKEQVEPADIIVFAGTIRDRYISARWKEFFDRSFFLGHIPRYTGKQVILLLEGPLAQVPGLRENLSSQFSGSNLVEIVTDEPEDSGLIDALIGSAAERAVQYAVAGVSRPPMFPSVAGRIVLRDAVWGDLRPIFRADHRYFKSHGLYDFPQYQYRKRISRFFFSLFTSLPPVQKRMKPAMKDHMIQGFARVFSESRVLKRLSGNKAV